MIVCTDLHDLARYLLGEHSIDSYTLEEIAELTAAVNKITSDLIDARYPSSPTLYPVS